MKCRKPSRTVRMHSVPQAHFAASADRVPGHMVSKLSQQRCEDSEAGTVSQLASKNGRSTNAANLAQCSLGSEAVSLAGQVNSVFSD